MHKLCFGTAGIPISTPEHSTENGIRQVNALGLDCMELEFVQNVNITREKAPIIRKTAQDNKVILTCHGQYYINLNAAEMIKIEQSRQRILAAARRAWECGAVNIVFHLGFYLGNSKTSTYQTIKKEVNEISRQLHSEGIGISLRAETTGKETQFGDLDELLALAQETGIMPCIDFAHLHARNGKMNTYDEFAHVLKKVENALGRNGLKDMHIHIAGIAYSPKGELHHLNLEESDLDYKALLTAWKEFDIAGTVICESPNIEKDALLLKKKYYE